MVLVIFNEKLKIIFCVYPLKTTHFVKVIFFRPKNKKNKKKKKRKMYLCTN